MRRFAAFLALLIAAVFLAGKLIAPARAQQAPVPKSSAVPRATVIASGAQLADIRGLAVDAAGNTFISAEISPAPRGCVARSVAGHASVAIFSNCAMAPREDPSGIAATMDGTGVFLANGAQNSIRLLDMSTGKVSLVPGANMRAGHSADASSSSASQFTLAGPAGLATDIAQDLYVADRGNNRILRLATGDDDFSSVAHVLDATAVATDLTGREVFVASPASNRIFKIDVTTGEISAFAGSGATPDAPSEFPAPVAAVQAPLAAPEGIAVDAGGNVFIADTGANQIVRVDAKANELSRVTLGSELNSPGALAIDREGNLFVADRGNHRVVEFAGVAQPQAASSLSLTPLPHDFGSQPTGGLTPQQTFKLTNNSTSAITLATSDFVFSGSDPNDFVQTNNCVPQLAAGGSCQVFVQFGPQGTGSRSTSLLIAGTDTCPSNVDCIAGTGDTFNLTAANQSAMTQTVVPGGTGTYSLSVTPDNVFSGAVNLTCPTQLPRSAGNTMTCAINPPQLTIAAGQASSFSVAITTLSGKTPGTMTFPFFTRRGPLPGGAWLAALLAFALALIAFAMRAKREHDHQLARGFADPARRRRTWAISTLAFLCAAGAAGCYHAPGGKTNPSTPPGIYLINISGTAQGASRAITLTLNVE